MNSLRISIIISLLLAAGSAFGCWCPDPLSVDNMIYRLVEDVSPYYSYYDNHSLLYVYDKSTEADNLALWRKQTGTDISDAKLRWYVYGSTESELKRDKDGAVRIFGSDGYRLLCIAKECEDFREYITDPWYYPFKGDKRIGQMKSLLKEVVAYKGRYASRYALQAVRIMVAMQKNLDAVSFWKRNSGHMAKDAVWSIAERHVARAFLQTGDTLAAARIYAGHGDITSLLQCGLERDKVWDTVYEYCPNSPFFIHELQYLLTHLDNEYLKKYREDEYFYDAEYFAGEVKHIAHVTALADRAIRERRVKDAAMWYYAKAALLDVLDKREQALKTVREGERVCRQGTFLSQSMRVLRIKIEAETCRYDSAYEARLMNDIRWLDMNGRRNITADVRRLYERKSGVDWDGTHFFYDTTFANKYYWGDVISRILVEVLSKRLKREGRVTDALLYCNLGVFWVMKNVYGKADCPNKCGNYSTTNLTNELMSMADSCSAWEIANMYERIARPSHGIDSMVVRYGKSDASFWHDIIGTHYIAEHKYGLAVKWLRNVSRQYQRSMSTWEYFDRDPFCYKIGWSSERRHLLNDRYGYKLKFAKEMAALERMMKNGRTADRRGEAMIRYGVGLRNQVDWCWTLTRNSDTSMKYFDTKENKDWYYETFYDITDSEKMIDKGIATISSRELKAQYLHLFVRNREVMKLYSDTQVAKSLRAHCDLWRDYSNAKGVKD